MLTICLIIIALAKNINSEQNEIFNLDVDQLMAAEIGDFYEARKKIFQMDNLSLNKYDRNKSPNALEEYLGNMSMNIRRQNPLKNKNQLQEQIRPATMSPEALGPKNFTKEELKVRRLKLQLEHVLSKDFTFTPNFDTKEDQFDQLTRRFDGMVQHKKKMEEMMETRREIYRSDQNPKLVWETKRRCMQLMEHFIYITRYKMAYAQLLRKKYFKSYHYKIGYLFALLRIVKNMTKWIYSCLATYLHKMSTVYFHLKMLEKIMKFQIDLKDIVKRIRRMNYDKNVWYNPNFYDYPVEKK